MENLQTCIERCTINGESFFYDSRFGTKIDEYILHPSYKKCFTSIAKPVSEIRSIVRDENSFHISIMVEGSYVQIMVRFYPVDKTFVCRDYDPTKIIPMILASDSKEYLKMKDHPFYKFGYTADYSWSPDNLKDVDFKYDKAIEELLSRPSRFSGFPIYEDPYDVSEREIKQLTNSILQPAEIKTPPKKKGLAFSNELDWYDGSVEYESPKDSPKSSFSGRVREPHSDSDCDSCGVFGVDDPDESLPTITQADIEEIEKLFSTNEPPDEILATMDSPEPKIADMPKKPLRKLPVKMTLSDEHQKIIQEQARLRNEEIIQLRELQRTIADMADYKPIESSLIPKIDERGDNL